MMQKNLPFLIFQLGLNGLGNAIKRKAIDSFEARSSNTLDTKLAILIQSICNVADLLD